MNINYNHLETDHSIASPREVLNCIFNDSVPKSLIDFGCGPGSWLVAAKELGIQDIHGIDGTDSLEKQNSHLLPYFTMANFTEPLNIERKFEVALCLEVAEHLPPEFGSQIISSLTSLSDIIIFSAACPSQPGQNHVNCQWPQYWQKIFNDLGYVCDDSIRWQIWDNKSVSPWYKQNIFIARKEPESAGNESRIYPVIHPEIAQLMIRYEGLSGASEGEMPLRWYLKCLRRWINRKTTN